MADQTEAERLAARREVPAPLVPSVPVDPMHPSIPQGVRTAYNAAVRAGLHVDLYRAQGPRLDASGAVLDPAHHSLGLRVVRKEPGHPRQLIVMTWRFKQATEKVPAAWVFESAFLRPGRVQQVEGAPYRPIIEKVTSDEAKAMFTAPLTG